MPGHQDPEIRRGAGLKKKKKKKVSALRASVWSKNKAGAGSSTVNLV